MMACDVSPVAMFLFIFGIICILIQYYSNSLSIFTYWSKTNLPDDLVDIFVNYFKYIKLLGVQIWTDRKSIQTFNGGWNLFLSADVPEEKQGLILLQFCIGGSLYHPPSSLYHPFSSPPWIG